METLRRYSIVPNLIVVTEVAEARKSIRKTQRCLANLKTKIVALKRPEGTVAASRRAMYKIVTISIRISS
ncbi:hypothetical protein KIN20_034661 [Parelaphostrongylus tenuis]|uniref:Uncharacterized protein n=1 Tax=Parelaphostrongylus tenuis TaxID=148309 RepID=A0AAD5RAC0_PARTN|nr:hypothetical protein KIN20_034661 [Parelaphostrongylus tenuis]